MIINRYGKHEMLAARSDFVRDKWTQYNGGLTWGQFRDSYERNPDGTFNLSEYEEEFYEWVKPLLL